MSCENNDLVERLLICENELDSRKDNLLTWTDSLEELSEIEGIIEEMYIEEIKAYLDAVKGHKPFPNTLEEDIKILKLLNLIEKANGGVAAINKTL